MRNTLLFVAAAFLVAAAPSLLAADVINGGFEEPVVTHAKGWNIYDSGTAGLGWTVEWWDGSTTYRGATRPDTAHLELHHGVNGWAHAEGDQHAELDTDWDGPDGGLTGEPASVAIYQDLTTQNAFYTLRYAWSPRPNHDDNVMRVYWDGELVAEHSAAGGATTSWSYEEVTVEASAGTTRLTFREVGDADSLGMFLDAVEVELEQLVCTEEEVPLCAGQFMDVGTVTVSNDDTYLYVTLETVEEGWYLAETHVAVATTLNGFPITRKGNPVPGRFPYRCDLDELATTCTVTIPLEDFCAEDTLNFAVHAEVVELAGDGCTEEVFWAEEVVAWVQGTQKDGTPVPPDRSDPTAALDVPDGDFFSLGFDLLMDGDAEGWLTVGFGAPVYNGPGGDVVVQEVTYGRDGYPLEAAEVFGQAEGFAYFAGVVTNHDDGTGLGTVGLPDGVVAVDSVILLDATDPALHSANGDGYDVDAVGACYLFEGEETAWGDGCDGTEFTNRRGWATYFEYTVNACAPCEE